MIWRAITVLQGEKILMDPPGGTGRKMKTSTQCWLSNTRERLFNFFIVMDFEL